MIPLEVIPKLLYFVSVGAEASYVRYDVIFFDAINLKTWQIGILKAMGPIMIFAGSVSISMFADHYHIHKTLLITALLITGILRVTNMLEIIYSNWFILLLSTCVGNFSGSAFSPLGDAFILKMCELFGWEYGHQRLWAALGWGSIGFLTGQLIEWFGVKSMFGVYGVSFCFLFALVAKYYTAPENVSKKYEKDIAIRIQAIDNPDTVRNVVQRPLLEENALTSALAIENNNSHSTNNQTVEESINSNHTENLPRIGYIPSRRMTRRVLCVLIANLVIFGALMATVEAFLFLFVSKHLSDNGTLLGSIVLVMTVSEVPVFIFAEKILKKFSFSTMFAFSHLSFAIRVFAYTYIPKENPWLILLLEPLHGITYAFMWVAAVQTAKDLAPEGYESTYQGLIGGSYFGAGMGIGAFIGGLVWEVHGPVFMYQGAAAISLLWMFIFYILWPGTVTNVTPLRKFPAFNGVFGGKREALCDINKNNEELLNRRNENQNNEMVINKVEL